MNAAKFRRLLRCHGLACATLLGAFLGLDGTTAQSAERLTVVELFTSQGCSSCPPADALLGELANDPDLLALSLPVDYWDYLGWRDTLARPEHRARQYAYAKRFGMKPYTPQMVIDGAIDVVGSKRREVLRKLDERKQGAVARVPVSVRLTTDEIVIDLGAGEARNAAVYLIRFEEGHIVRIRAGENAGKTLRYTHVVNDVRPIGTWNGAPASLRVPRADLARGEGEHFPVILQQGETGPILGAADLPAFE
jgi:hypothetical protein